MLLWMGWVYPLHSLRLLHWFDIRKIDRNSFRVASHEYAFQLLVRGSIDLLMLLMISDLFGMFKDIYFSVPAHKEGHR